MSAYADLIAGFDSGEVLETIVFSPWSSFQHEPDHPIPPELFGVVLTEAQAKPLMQTWRVERGHGTALVYPFYAYTNKRVWFIREWDGSTTIHSIPLHPYSMGKDLPELH
jgi:hypothetical protein